MNLKHLPEDWRLALRPETEKRYFQEILAKLWDERQQYKVFPSERNLLRALELTPLNDTKVVILGQDPYHGVGQANGLAFSVPVGKRVPPSLRNIYREIQLEFDYDEGMPTHGDLTYWAEQGVLLLNTSLTVREGQPGSHFDLGWHQFTDRVIELLSENDAPKIFLLWGREARAKKGLINRRKHPILETSHPSPYSFHLGFEQCGHFQDANRYLKLKGLEPIDWRIL